MNTTMDSALTHDLLGWRPVQPGLVDDLDAPRPVGDGRVTAKRAEQVELRQRS